MMRLGRLLTGCATGAVLVAMASPAASQALQGNSTVVAGSAVITTGVGTTDVEIGASETVIDWRTFDQVFVGTTDFLPDGSTVTFRDGGLPGYTVLNRIIPLDGQSFPIDRPISLNGQVNSLLGANTGGNVWFYNAGGIIVGPTGAFNVGSLILTTNDIQFVAADPNGSPPTLGSIYGPGGLVEFQGPAGSAGFIDIQPGAQISATGANAYVGLVAPRVIQQGLVQADGQIAYIAAEQLDMTINGGLFDFTITVGTTDPEGIVHTGTTTGPASTSAADQQRISMVALPKNDALTMLLSGSIGYSPAVSAANEGSEVVLAAGWDSAAPLADPGNRMAGIEIGNAIFTNALTAYASETISVMPNASETLFEADATLHALNTIIVTAESEEQVTAAGDLVLNAGEPGAGGGIAVQAFGSGVIDVTGRLAATASPAAFFGGAPGDATGGAIELVADGGTVSSSETFLSVSAFGGPDLSAAGTATGGTIDIAVLGGGTIAAPNFLSIEADGRGGDSAGIPGDGTGGAVTLVDQGGTLDFGPVLIAANGTGGAAPGEAGDGFGGTVLIDIASQAQAWQSLSVEATAAAGRAAPASAGLSGSATASPNAVLLTVAGAGSIDLAGNLSLNANSIVDVNGAAGFAGQAGGIQVQAVGGGALSVSGDAQLRADARLFVDAAPNPDTAPPQQGGSVSILADGGAFAAANLDVSADAYGASATTAAGTASGGTALVAAINSGTILVDDGLGTSLARIAADAFGAPGPVAAHALGGEARLTAGDGSITVEGDTLVSGGARGAELPGAPPAGGGFDATGNLAVVELGGPLGFIDTDGLTIRADGDARLRISGAPAMPGGQPIQGDGGDGIGGNASLIISSGGFQAGPVSIDSSGIGGASAARDASERFLSGAGTGGTSHLGQSGGTANLGRLDLVSDGLGGGGGPAATGGNLAAAAGNGTGGAAGVQLTGGVLTPLETTVWARGIGASGMDHADGGAASDGGNGMGGSALLELPAGSIAEFFPASVSLRADGVGGDGGLAAGGTDGDGGDGTGSIAAANLADGAFAMGTVEIGASGTGGNGVGGAIGGTGIGGQAAFAVVDTVGPVGARTLDALTIEASGNAGLSGIFPEQSDAGDVQLTAQVFDAASGIVINGSVVLNSFGGVIGTPSGVTGLISGAPLTIGGNLTVEAGEIAIAAAQPLVAGADVFLSAERAFSSTGLIATDGALVAQGNAGVDAERLASGGTTFLGAGAGLVIVSVDLASTGPVSVVGQSIDISSLGGLQFAQLDALTGDVSVRTLGDLGAAGVAAPGSILLTSSGGNVATADLAAGTWAYVGAGGGATLGNVSAGTDAAASTFGGDLAIGDVTAGDEIWLSVLGTDPLRVLTSGDLVSTGLGNDAAAGPAALFGAYPGNAGPLGNVTHVRGSGSLVLGAVETPGRAILVADGAGILAGAIDAPEGIVLLGRGDIGLAGATTAGRFHVADSAMFLPNLPDAYDPASLDGMAPVDTDGSLTVTGPVMAGTVSVAIGGNATIANMASDGTTWLRATGGTLDVASLTSAGQVTALGGAIDIASPGALTFTDLDATAGPLSVLAAGNLALATAHAAGAASLRSTGGALSASGAIGSGGALELAGGAGLAAGTVAAGRTTLVQSANGNVTVAALTSAGAVTAQGGAIDIASPGALTFANAQATAGGLRVATQGNLTLTNGGATGPLNLSSLTGAVSATGPLNAGGNASIVAPLGVTLASLASGGTTLVQSANGNMTVAALTSAGAVTALGGAVDIASPGALTFAGLDATAGPLSVVTAGNLTLPGASAPGAVTLRSTGGALGAAGSVNSGGNVVAEGLTGVTVPMLVSDGTTQLASANGLVDIDTLVSPGTVSVVANGVDIAGSGPLTFTTAEARDALSITASGDLTFAWVGAGLDLVLASTGGDLTVTGDATGLFGNLVADGDIRVGGDLASGGNLFVDAGGTLVVEGGTETGDATISADGGIALASLTTGEITTLEAVGGSIAVPALVTGGRVTARGLAVDIGSPGGLLFDEAVATAGDVAIRTVDDLTIEQLVAASGAIDLRGATFTLSGLARAPAISIASADIVLGGDAAIGLRGETQGIELTNRDPANETFIGGAAQAGGYSLDAGEAERLFADVGIFLGVPADAGPTEGFVTVGDLALSFGADGNIGAGGQLEIGTPTQIAVSGAVAAATVSADDSLRLGAGLIELDTDSGSIAMLGASETPLGRLGMTADRVAIASGTALGTLRTGTDFAAINAALDQPGGGPQPLRAGTIAIDVGEALYIQNSGETALYRDRAGFTANSLAINTAQPGTRIAVNGRILTADGALTGLVTQQRVTINGSPAAAGGLFDPGSTINGCVIGGRCAPPPGTTPPSDSDLLSPLPPDATPPTLFVAPIIELASNDPLIEPPLVDEPITGIGNDDLWEPRCAEDDDACLDAGQP